MAGELAQIGLLIGSEDRQNMLIYAIAFDFTYQCLSPRPKAVPRISDTASHLPTASWVTTRKLAPSCDNKAINRWCVTLPLAISVISCSWDYKQTTTEGYHERLFCSAYWHINAHRKLYTHHVTYRFLSSRKYRKRSRSLSAARYVADVFRYVQAVVLQFAASNRQEWCRIHRHRVGWHNHFTNRLFNRLS